MDASSIIVAYLLIGLILTQIGASKEASLIALLLAVILWLPMLVYIMVFK